MKQIFTLEQIDVLIEQTRERAFLEGKDKGYEQGFEATAMKPEKMQRSNDWSGWRPTRTRHRQYKTCALCGAHLDPGERCDCLTAIKGGTGNAQR